MSWLTETTADIRYAVRSLRHNPGFSVVAVGVLGVGIAAATAIFSVVNAVLIRSLPYPHPEQLTIVWETSAQQNVKREGPSGSDFWDWRGQSRLYQDMAAIEIGTGTVTGLGEPRQIPAMRVSTNLFSVLGVSPAQGRVFLPQDGRGGRNPLIVVSYAFWQRELAGDPHVVGRKVMMDLIPYTVIGVLNRDFWLPLQSEIFVPWPDDELRSKARLAHDLGVFGRMRPDVSVASAAAELNAIQARLRAEHPEMEGWGVTVVSLQSAMVAYIRPALVVLFGAVIFLLLIACTNIANLLMIRADTRRREVAVRAALGAGRWRLWRQFLTESMVMGMAAGALGILLATWGILLLRAVVPETIPIPDAAAESVVRPFGMDARALAFSLAISLATGLLFGSFPALHALKVDLWTSLKQGARAAAGGRKRLHQTLLAAEIALALVLLAGAGLMLKSFDALHHSDFGFRASHLLTMEMELPTDTRYQKASEQREFFSRVLEGATALPGVQSAALTSVLPLHPEDQRERFLIENGPVLPAHERLQADYRRVSPSFFIPWGSRSSAAANWTRTTAPTRHWRASSTRLSPGATSVHRTRSAGTSCLGASVWK
jgi:putative ABC transport system permease protein